MQSSFVGAIAIGDLVKTTLGPKGMVGVPLPCAGSAVAPASDFGAWDQDKILVSFGQGTVQVTNDGATILQSIGVDNPAAKVLVEISKVQDAEVGDGTTSVAGAAVRVRAGVQAPHCLLPPSLLAVPSPKACVVMYMGASGCACRWFFSQCSPPSF